jgi:hypothetical protein
MITDHRKEQIGASCRDHVASVNGRGVTDPSGFQCLPEKPPDHQKAEASLAAIC